MTERFLHLFPQFRDMEALNAMQAERAETTAQEITSLMEDIENLRHANEELVTEKRILEDRLTTALSDKDQLWDTLRTAMDGERYALHTMVNHASQKSGAGIPYQTAHSIPASELPKRQDPGGVGRRARMLGSEAAARATRDFVMSLVQPPADAEKVA